jgi:glycosyltransferase involved in cell wall biosynthesis
MRPIKVAHITTVDDSLYGLLLNQLRNLQHAGYAVLGISTPGRYVHQLEAAGIRHIPVSMTRAITPRRDLVALAQLMRVLRREQVTIVHTHTPKAGLLGQLAARLARTPIIVNTIHGFYFHEHMPAHKRHFYMTMERLAALCSSSIISQNHEDMRTAIRQHICRPEQIKHLGNGIDLQLFDPDRVPAAELERRRAAIGIPSHAPVIGFVGRLAGKRKGFEDFLAAGQLLAERIPDVRFLIVGASDQGKDDAVGPEAAHRFGIADRCYFLGQRPSEELPALYLLMDMLVLPSLFEGLPRVIMEASAMGVPSVATDVKGNREAVVPNRNGLLVPLGDVPMLASTIEALIADDIRRQHLSSEARRLARERFDEQLVFQKVRAEYAALLTTARAPAKV